MVYDEGFGVEFGNVKYFAFNRFYDDGQEYKSDCSQTLIGWYHNLNNNRVGCYKGFQHKISPFLLPDIQQ